MVRVVELLLPVERRRAVVGEELARELRVNALGELARLLQIGLGGLAPDQVRVGRVGQPARDRRLEPRLDVKKPSAVRPLTASMNGRSRSSTSVVSSLAPSASVRATSTVGTLQTSAARRAATSLLIASCVGTSTLPPMWPHFFAEDSWSSKCTPAAPASIICFISSKAFSTPPKPASASATIGFSQSMVSLPSACWICRRGAAYC